MKQPKLKTADAEAIRKFMRNRKAYLRSTPTRRFPKLGTFSSTKEYVELFSAMNAGSVYYGATVKVEEFFQPLNAQPFTLPEGPEFTVEHFESCPACGVTL